MKNTESTVRLLAEHGMLHTPLAACVDALQRAYHTADPVLIARYDAGDCDTINWPNPHEENLRSALYDAREMGVIPDVQTVLLPDGKEFAI